MFEPGVNYVPPGGVFWERGRVQMIRHCDIVFELLCDGIPVMPVGSFERINQYLWAEFEVM